MKRVHVCWGPALSFFYYTDFVYSYLHKFSQRLLSIPFTKQIDLRALLIDIKEVSTALPRSYCASSNGKQVQLDFGLVCTQDAGIAILWCMFPRIVVIIAKCKIGVNSK